MQPSAWHRGEFADVDPASNALGRRYSRLMKSSSDEKYVLPPKLSPILDEKSTAAL